MSDRSGGAVPGTGRFWGFIALMLALMVLFVGLGTWQVERLGEKERLIADVAARMDLPPTELPPASEWAAFDADAWNFRPVKLAGTWLPARTVLVFTSLADQRGKYGGPGYWVLTPLQLASGGTVFINRGFVPQESSAAYVAGGVLDPGLASLTGIARASEETGSFTPQPDTARRIEWVRNTARLARLAGPVPEPVAPIYVDLPSLGAGVLPQGGETVLSFPNNHLGYAITWYGFAVLVPFLLFFWARRQRRTPSPGL
ncbi:SURF1 family protein [Devosia sp.]|uniref:SURF1 family protein n=1 Tax=Devosia sp. TaxID=1871048 RepID=UPI001AC0C6D1|nr:SURF1 family protein [Devosia sp.]MBN9307927.1 SURF1 family protein [Devosia sp.]